MKNAILELLSWLVFGAAVLIFMFALGFAWGLTAEGYEASRGIFPW